MTVAVLSETERTRDDRIEMGTRTMNTHVAVRGHGTRSRGRLQTLLAGLLSLAATHVHAQLSVGASGTPAYSLSIPVPPGVAGTAPNLGLVYSAGANGALGVGWSIQGTSAVTRCAATIATDGVRGAVGYLPSDKLCLDGERLIQTNDVGTISSFPQANDSLGLSSGVREFRTEKDSYARIRAYGTLGSVAANGPAYFKVWTKAGQVFEYGASPSAGASPTTVAYAQGKTVAMMWHVARISDTLGNYIDFKYEQRDIAWGSGNSSSNPVLGHESNLTEVQYSGNKVLFCYADRASTSPQDSAEYYHAGSKSLSRRLLQTITTYVNATTTTCASPAAGAVAVKTLKLTYDNQSVSKRSRLISVKDCSGGPTSTTCLPATTFSYSGGTNEAYVQNAAFASSPLNQLSMLAADKGILIGDFNGDGKTDIIRWSDTASENELYFSNGDGGFTKSTSFNITSDRLYKSDGCYKTIVGDFNGDGLSDLFRYSSASNADGSDCTTFGPSQLYLSNGSGTFTLKSLTGLPTLDIRVGKTIYDCNPMRPAGVGCAEPGPRTGRTSGYNFYIFDVNGDGRLDVVWTILPGYSLTLTPPTGCTIAVCTRVFYGDGQGGFTEQATNIAAVSVYTIPDLSYKLWSYIPLADIDGDGLTDLAAGAFRSRGDGNFDSLSPGPGCTANLDFNGDGKMDCLNVRYPYTVTSNVLLASTGQTRQQVTNFNMITAGYELGAQAGGVTAPATSGSMPADINGDGKTDIIRWDDTWDNNAVFLSNGDGTFSKSSTFSLTESKSRLKSSDGTADFIVGDFTGRGTTEFLRLRAFPTSSETGSNQLYVKADALPPDQLIGVTTSLGSTTTLAYMPLSNAPDVALGARYTSDFATSPAVYPKADVTAPMYVVTTVTADTGVGAPGTSILRTDYSYFGLKADLQGRGVLGFREVRRQSAASDGTVVSAFGQYLQEFPYIGAVALSETRLGTINSSVIPPRVLNRVSNIYCDQTSDPGAETTATQAVPCFSTSRIRRPYLRSSTQTGEDLAQVALPVSVTTSTYNAAGNPLTVAISASGVSAGATQTSSKTTTNSYGSDDIGGDNWVLGRLLRATVRSVVNDVLASITTDVGSGSSAIVGTGPTQFATLSSIAFGNVAAGSSSTLQSTLTNTGASTLTLTIPGAGSVSGTDFTFVSTTCAATLAPTATCAINVKFQPTAGSARSGSLGVATGAGLLAGALSGTGLKANLVFSPTSVSFGSLAVGSTLDSASITLSNTGNAAAAGVALAAPTGFSIAASTCATSLAVGGTCTFKIRFSPTAQQSYSGNVTASGTGLTASNLPVSGTGTGSTVTVSSNGASALIATKGGAVGTGVVTFLNSGNVAATLTMSGLTAPYSVSPASCSAPASGGSCSITVSMATGGSIGSQGSQTLTATGGSTGPVTASVSGTLTGSSVTTTSNGAATLTATQGSAAATGVVTFTNGGNVAATLTMSGLSAPYSVSPATCSAAASGGTCSVTVSMATSGAIGGQGTQTLTATGGTTGPATASVAGTVTGSVITLTGNGAGALSATQGAAAATGTVTYTNSGNAAATLTFSGLSAPYSASPASCSAPASGGTCSVTVSMSTGGSIGPQGSQTLVATGGTGGAVNATIAGTINGSSVAMTANSANALTAAQGAAAASGTVTFTNSGNVAASLTMSGLSAPYAVTPASCSAAAGGGTCAVTVTMSTSGALGGQGAQTLAASGGTNGVVNASVSGTVTGTVATLTSAAPNLGAVYVGAASPSANVTIRNDGNVAMTLSGLSGNTALFPVNGNTCTSVAPGASCTITLGMSTASAGSGPVAVTTVGALSNASFAINGSVSEARSSWSPLSLSFNVVAGQSSTQNVTLANIGSGPLSGVWNGPLTSLPTGFTANTSGCAAVTPGGSCTVGVTFSPTAAGFYGGSGVLPTNITSAANTLTLSGNGIAAPNVSATPVTLTASSTTPTAASGSVSYSNASPTATTLTFSATGGASVSPATLSCGANASCGSVVVTTPTAAGTYNGTLTGASSMGGSVAAVPLNLSVAAASFPNISVSPATFDLGQTSAGQVKTTTYTVTNSGGAGTLSGSVTQGFSPIFGTFSTAAGGTCSGALAANSSCTILVSFTGALQCGGTITTRTGTLNLSAGPSSTSATVTARNQVVPLNNNACQ